MPTDGRAAANPGTGGCSPLAAHVHHFARTPGATSASINTWSTRLANASAHPHGTLAWSYDLLSEEDKVLFRQFTVFAGGFTLEGAQTLSLSGQTTPAPDEQGDTLLEKLAELVDKSLVIPLDTVAGTPRFHMLVTIRQYALEQLDAREERADQQKRHAEIFLRLTEQSSPTSTFSIVTPGFSDWTTKTATCVLL